jgi:hypothetical protein
MLGNFFSQTKFQTMTTGQLTDSQKKELEKFFYMWLHDKKEVRFFDLLEKYNLDAFDVSGITEPIAEQYKKEKLIAA